MLHKCKLGNQYELVVIWVYDSYNVDKERERERQRKCWGKKRELQIKLSLF